MRKIIYKKFKIFIYHKNERIQTIQKNHRE
jgi:hypothetical protein